MAESKGAEMAKTKNITQDELKKLFEKAKDGLRQLGKETSVWMKKGEIELSRISKIGKLELDIVGLNMKKEKLFRDIGRRVIELDLGEKIGDQAIRDMSDRAETIISESDKKKREISRIKKEVLKSKTAGLKKKNKQS